MESLVGSMGENDVIAGLDVGGTKLLGVLVDRHGVVRSRLRRPTTFRGDDDVRDGILTTLKDVIDIGREQGYVTVGVGVGSPGYVDSEHGVIVDATNLGVIRLHLAPALSETFGVNALVLHDVKAAALAEASLGAGANADHLLYVNLGTGIAAGMILDGQVFHGSGYRAGEFGHIVMEPNGEPCPCGLRGCLELLAAGPAIASQARARLAASPDSLIGTLAHGDLSTIRAETVAAAAREGDALALDVLGNAATYLGLAIATQINMLDLETVVIGGGMSHMGDLLLDLIRAATDRFVLKDNRPLVPIVPSALGGDAGAIGAAWALPMFGVL